MPRRNAVALPERIMAAQTCPRQSVLRVAPALRGRRGARALLAGAATRALAALVLLALVLVARSTDAEEVAVPVGLQAELVAKVAAYDKSFAARAGDRVHVLLVTRSGDSDSVRTAAHMESALRDVKEIGGLPHDESTVSYPGAKALADTVKSRRIAIVYVTPGLGGEAEAIRDALAGVSVLSVGAVAEYVPKGIVLGFDVVSGKPKLVVNLAQAKRQDVQFKAEVLKLMRVIE
jgi:hypothetical protein